MKKSPLLNWTRGNISISATLQLFLRGALSNGKKTNRPEKKAGRFFRSAKLKKRKNDKLEQRTKQLLTPHCREHLSKFGNQFGLNLLGLIHETILNTCWAWSDRRVTCALWNRDKPTRSAALFSFRPTVSGAPTAPQTTPHEGANQLQSVATGRAGKSVWNDALPWRVHARGARPEAGLDRGTRPGKKLK